MGGDKAHRPLGLCFRSKLWEVISLPPTLSIYGASFCLLIWELSDSWFLRVEGERNRKERKKAKTLLSLKPCSKMKVKSISPKMFLCPQQWDIYIPFHPVSILWSLSCVISIWNYFFLKITKYIINRIGFIDN